MEEYFDPKPSPARRQDLERAYQQATLIGDIEIALKMYADWKISNRVRFPFAGGRADQPSWILHNLDTLAMIDAYYEMLAEEEREQSRAEQDMWGR